MSLLDPIGAALSLLSTYQFTQLKRSAWLVSLSAVVVNMILYKDRALYGKMLLDVLYIPFICYGYWNWGSGFKASSQPLKKIATLSQKAIYYLVFFSGINSIWFAYFLKVYFDSDVPIWDASATVLALVAQWLTSRKYIECWIVWFIVDAIVCGLQILKGIPFHAAVHIVYMLLAIKGYLYWKDINSKEGV